jgi:hypothetical protein
MPMNVLHRILGACLLLATPLPLPGQSPPQKISIPTEAQLAGQLAEGKATVAVAVERLRALLPAFSAEDPRPPMELAAFETLFDAACARATQEELRALGEILAGVPVDHEHFAECLDDVTTAQLRLTIERLKQQPEKLRLPPFTKPVPDEFSIYPQELRDAWIAWNRAVAPYSLIATTAVQAKVVASPEERDQTLQNALREPKAEGWKQLLVELTQIEREPLMFTGSAYARRHRGGVLLALLQDGMVPEALGALCQQRRLTAPDVAPRNKGVLPDIDDLFAEFLKTLGLDWEQLLLGSLLSGEMDGRAFDFRSRRRNALRDLGRYGSPRGLQLGLSLIREKRLDPQDAFYFLVGAARPAPAPDAPAPANAELPAEVRKAITEAIGNALGEATPPRNLRSFLSQIPNHVVPDLRAPLEALVKHPSHLIAGQARQMLASKQLIDPNTPIAAPPPPMRLHLTMDGRPLAKTQLQIYALELGSQSITTDDDGHAAIALDTLIDPSRVKSVYLSAQGPRPRSSTTEKAEDVWHGPWIDANVAVEAGVNREFEAAITTVPLEIALDPRDIGALQKPATLILRRTETSNFLSRNLTVEAVTSGSYTFEGLQIDSYRLEVFADGAAHYLLPRIPLGKTGSIRLIKLQPGRAVNARILSPTGENVDLTDCTLTQDGRPVEMHFNGNSNRMEGLPFGKYHLHLPTTAQHVAEIRKRGGFIRVEPKERHQGLDRDFELTADSPMVVDLGEIRLQAVTAKK